MHARHPKFRKESTQQRQQQQPKDQVISMRNRPNHGLHRYSEKNQLNNNKNKNNNNNNNNNNNKNLTMACTDIQKRINSTTTTTTQIKDIHFVLIRLDD
jgi:hypothetical protein